MSFLTGEYIGDIMKKTKALEENKMLKRIVVMLLVMLFLVTAVSCGEKKILHCDKCGAEVEVDAKSNMTEEWSLFCDTCGEEVEKEVMDIIEK